MTALMTALTQLIAARKAYAKALRAEAETQEPAMDFERQGIHEPDMWLNSAWLDNAIAAQVATQTAALESAKAREALTQAMAKFGALAESAVGGEAQ